MKQRRIRKPRHGLSRSGCRRISWILTVSPIRKEPTCRWEDSAP
jgi:hypothetical protein